MARGGKREGAGRKTGEITTHTIRVPLSISREDAECIAEVKALVEEWDKDCQANPKSARRDYLRKAVNQLRALGL